MGQGIGFFYYPGKLESLLTEVTSLSNEVEFVNQEHTYYNQHTHW